MRKLFYVAAAFAMMAGTAPAQTANGSPGVPAAGGATSGKPSAMSPVSKSVLAAQAAKARRDKADEKQLEHDMKICIGC